jgi:hypothetical protein
MLEWYHLGTMSLIGYFNQFAEVFVVLSTTARFLTFLPKNVGLQLVPCVIHIQTTNLWS